MAAVKHSSKSPNVVWHTSRISSDDRQIVNRHRSCVVWFTGLSGAGKSTLAYAVEERLFHRGCRTFVLDGDNIRHGLCGDLGFSEQDRKENIRRVAETSKLFAEAGVITMAAFISPFQADRRYARQLIGSEYFFEVYCKCSIEICEGRDVKGIYKKARAGEISNFTGISSPYEAPNDPELILDTGLVPLGQCVGQILASLQERGVFSLV